MSASFSRSICTHCLPGANETYEPSSVSLSPSVTKSSVPTMVLVSLAVTFLPLARFTVPAGTVKTGHVFNFGSRFGTSDFTSVPMTCGLGKSVTNGTLSCASATPAEIKTARTEQFKKNFFMEFRQSRSFKIQILSSLDLLRRDFNAFLSGDGFVGLVDDVFAAERL